MRLFSFIAMSVILCGFSYACTVEKSGDSSSDLLILLGATQSISRSSTPGTNLAQVGFDGIPVFSNMPVTACDVDNSSAQGIIVDLTSVMGGHMFTSIRFLSRPLALFPRGWNSICISLHRTCRRIRFPVLLFGVRTQPADILQA